AWASWAMCSRLRRAAIRVFQLRLNSHVTDPSLVYRSTRSSVVVIELVVVPEIVVTGMVVVAGPNSNAKTIRRLADTGREYSTPRSRPCSVDDASVPEAS